MDPEGRKQSVHIFHGGAGLGVLFCPLQGAPKTKIRDLSFVYMYGIIIMGTDDQGESGRRPPVRFRTHQGAEHALTKRESWCPNKNKPR